MHSRLKFSILNKKNANNSINIIKSRQRMAGHLKFHRKLVKLMWAELWDNWDKPGLTKRFEAICKMIRKIETMYPNIYFQEV